MHPHGPVVKGEQQPLSPGRSEGWPPPRQYFFPMACWKIAFQCQLGEEGFWTFFFFFNKASFYIKVYKCYVHTNGLYGLFKPFKAWFPHLQSRNNKCLIGQLWRLNKIILVVHLPQCFICIKCFKKVSTALGGWLSPGWSIIPFTKSLHGSDLWLGCVQEATSGVSLSHRCFSFSLSLFPL